MGAPRGPHRHRACPPGQQQIPLRLASSAGVEEQPALPASPFRRTWQAGMKKALERGYGMTRVVVQHSASHRLRDESHRFAGHRTWATPRAMARAAAVSRLSEALQVLG
jgi:hypothetical protein